MKYDIKIQDAKGFYVWNKPTFFVKKDDNRYDSMVGEKKETGISTDETWSLKTNIAIFLVPRLKLFKEKQNNLGGCPSCFNNIDEWNIVLDKIIFAFEAQLKDMFDVPQKYLEKYKDRGDDYRTKAENEYWKDIQEGLKLFAEYYGCLWW